MMRWSLALAVVLMVTTLSAAAAIAYPYPPPPPPPYPAYPYASEPTRPARPSAFTSVKEVEDYVMGLKNYYTSKVTGGRYGKRSSMNPELLKTYLYLINHY